MQSDKIVFSIIIPHKNTPALLSRLLQSIPKRDDIEIIIVDDKSSPDIVDFDRFPGNERADVKCVFSKEGRGAGFARNEGLKLATGSWLLFADADDMFTHNISLIFDRFKDNSKTDMVFLNAQVIDEKGNLSSISLNRYIENYLQGKKYSLEVLRYYFWAPWSRLIRKDIFDNNNIHFEEVPTGNDVMAIVTASNRASTFEVVSDVVYLYYKPSAGSQTSKKYDFRSYLLRLDQRFRLNSMYEDFKFPYLLPISRAFSNREWNSTEQVRQIKERYKFSGFADTLLYLKYIYGKLKGTI